jgi:hypothetical protein
MRCVQCKDQSVTIKIWTGLPLYILAASGGMAWRSKPRSFQRPRQRGQGMGIPGWIEVGVIGVEVSCHARTSQITRQ